MRSYIFCWLTDFFSGEKTNKFRTNNKQTNEMNYWMSINGNLHMDNVCRMFVWLLDDKVMLLIDGFEIYADEEEIEKEKKKYLMYVDTNYPRPFCRTTKTTFAINILRWNEKNKTKQNSQKI